MQPDDQLMVRMYPVPSVPSVSPFCRHKHKYINWQRELCSRIEGSILPLGTRACRYRCMVVTSWITMCLGHSKHALENEWWKEKGGKDTAVVRTWQLEVVVNNNNSKIQTVYIIIVTYPFNVYFWLISGGALAQRWGAKPWFGHLFTDLASANPVTPEVSQQSSRYIVSSFTDLYQWGRQLVWQGRGGISYFSRIDWRVTCVSHPLALLPEIYCYWDEDWLISCPFMLGFPVFLFNRWIG